jgi:hypothetical protein
MSLSIIGTQRYRISYGRKGNATSTVGGFARMNKFIEGTAWLVGSLASCFFFGVPPVVYVTGFMGAYMFWSLVLLDVGGPILGIWLMARSSLQFLSRRKTHVTSN